MPGEKGRPAALPIGGDLHAEMIAEDVSVVTVRSRDGTNDMGGARMVPRAHTIGTNAVSGVYQLSGSKTER